LVRRRQRNPKKLGTSSTQPTKGNDTRIELNIILEVKFQKSMASGSRKAGLINKRNFEKANIEYRIMNVEGMYSIYFI